MSDYSEAKKIILAERTKLERLLSANADMEIALDRLHQLGAKKYFVFSHFNNVSLHQPAPLTIDVWIDKIDQYYCDNSNEARGQGSNHSVIDLKTGEKRF